MNETREDLEDEITRLNKRVRYLENELENSSKNHNLIKKERMYRLLADSCPDVIYRISIPKGRYDYISPSCLRGCGRTQKEFYQKPLLIREMLHPDWKDCFNETWLKQLIENSVSQTEYQIIHSSGDVIWVSQKDVVIRDHDKNPVAIQGIARNITPEKRAEDMEHRFSDIIENTQDAVVSNDLEGRVLSWNRGAEEIYGYSESETMGKNVEMFTPPGCDYELPSILKMIKEGEMVRNYPTLGLKKDGSIINVSLTVSPINDSNGYIKGVSIISRDVTPEKKAEKELKESEERYRLLVEKAQVGILLIDPDGRIIDINPKFLEMCGSRSEDVSRRVNLLRTPEVVKSGFSGDFKRCLETGEDVSSEHRYLSQWGKETYSQFHLNPIKDEDGEVVNVLATFSDITYRKNMEEALKESEEKFREVFNNANDAVYLHEVLDGMPGRYIEVNDVSCSMLGYKREELLEMTPQDVSSEDSDEIGSMMAELLKDGSKTFESEHLTRDGDRIPVEVSSHCFKLRNKDVIVSVARDITQWKEAEKIVHDSLKEKELLLREIHHRVKNNLMIISSLLNLQSIQINDTEVLKMIKDSQSRARSMAVLHEKLYNSSDLKRINFGEYIESITEYLFNTYSTNNHVSLKMDVEYLMLDINTCLPLGLIVNELVSNSLKYAFPKGMNGCVTVRFHRSPENYILEVEDDGVGLPEDMDIEQADSMGMKLVSNFTKQLNGEMELIMKNGTCFRIKFNEEEFSASSDMN
ncbi:PAS domain S-box protein [Methanobacterium congolense]|uniref:Methyl sulfide methyltransferase-associated sensor n=1 Tax=Methanobacterium congolense TaxID=118062 RepID=A0A1D3L2G6_9EURY|nr:PAS domain S-box protein [Methanobacterium congolense]SCG85854.1 Methyl sulfide methyltransferase-associated sensor [Methanobacterium congolense]